MSLRLQKLRRGVGKAKNVGFEVFTAVTMKNAENPDILQVLVLFSKMLRDETCVYQTSFIIKRKDKHCLF
jgi:hypothetical protein